MGWTMPPRVSQLGSWVIAIFCVLVAVGFALVASGKVLINVTPSLPQTFFWASKLKPDEPLKAYDLIGFLPPEGEEVINPFNARFLKIVRGVPGDEIDSHLINGKKIFFINEEAIGEAKQQTSSGKILEPGPTGILTEDDYFVWTPHEDSYDSRYKTMGWIKRSDILVRAKPIF